MYLRRPQPRSRPSRLLTLAVGVSVMAGLITARLFYLQVVQHSYYLALAQGQRQIFEQLVPSRGQILLRDRDGKTLSPLAINRKLYLVYGVPREIDNGASVKNLDAVIAFLQPLVNLPADTLRQKLSDRTDLYVPLAHQVAPAAADQIAARITVESSKPPQERTFSGIYLQPEEWRYYPEATLAAHLVGFVGSIGDQQSGRYGLEEYFNDTLKGRSGFLEAERDGKRRLIAVGERSLTPAQDGDDLILTIDRRVQFIVERELRDALKRYQAKDATAIVLRPYSGDIVAMASLPTFDPNAFNKVEDIGAFRNRAIADLYEPGSIEKGIVVASALDAGVITPESVVHDTGSIKIDRFTIRNSDGRAHGYLTPTEVLELSSNIGAARIAEKLGREKLREYMARFGLTALTGVSLAGEASPKVREKFGPVDVVTAAFGQGFSVTPLQMATAYATIANGGKLVAPRLVAAVRHPDGTIAERPPQVLGDAVSPRAARLTAAMLVAAVRHGYGKLADVPGYKVAGKTGTAQITDAGTRRYSNTRFNHTFVGFAPADDAEFVVLVKLSEPHARFAETTATPVVGNILRELFRLYRILPDKR